jgi:hypothetical protein
MHFLEKVGRVCHSSCLLFWMNRKGHGHMYDWMKVCRVKQSVWEEIIIASNVYMLDHKYTCSSGITFT